MWKRLKKMIWLSLFIQKVTSYQNHIDHVTINCKSLYVITTVLV